MLHRLQVTFRQSIVGAIYSLLRIGPRHPWQPVQRRMAERLLRTGLGELAADTKGVIVLTFANTFDRHAAAQIAAQAWANRDATVFAVIELQSPPLAGRPWAVVTSAQAEGLLRGHPDAQRTLEARPRSSTVR